MRKYFTSRSLSLDIRTIFIYHVIKGVQVFSRLILSFKLTGQKELWSVENYDHLSSGAIADVIFTVAYLSVSHLMD